MGRKVSTLKKGRRFLRPCGNPSDPDGLFAYMQRYLEWMQIKAYSESTIWSTERYLRDFIAWCDIRGIERPHEITKPIIERYQSTLFYYRKKDGQPLSLNSQRGKLTPVKGYFKWLARENHILFNPASELDLPRMPRRLPKHILTEKEVEKVMAQPAISEPLGIRDRAVLETLYSTGIRRMEIINLKLWDIDAQRGTLTIRQGKGRKDRVIPIGSRAILWINKYLNEVRPQLVVPPDDATLFLTRTGEYFNDNWLSRTVAQYVDAAKLNKRGSCHLFRHTMATLMLENGADIRFIQAMLGHAELSTTEIYTQVSVKKLKAVHELTHPGKLRKPGHHDNQDTAEQGSDEDLAAELLLTLDIEADAKDLA